jgi:hypothetical protein
MSKQQTVSQAPSQSPVAKPGYVYVEKVVTRKNGSSFKQWFQVKAPKGQVSAEGAMAALVAFADGGGANDAVAAVKRAVRKPRVGKGNVVSVEDTFDAAMGQAKLDEVIAKEKVLAEQSLAPKAVKPSKVTSLAAWAAAKVKEAEEKGTDLLYVLPSVPPVESDELLLVLPADAIISSATPETRS